jgi:hypothetical protein
MNILKINKKYLILMLGAMIVIFCFLFYSPIPPRSITYGIMSTLRNRIIEYTQNNGKYPSSLKELPKIRGYPNTIKDAWGEEIIYKRKGDIITLMSYGKDKKIGGENECHDMIGSFKLELPFDIIQARDIEWIQDPFEPFQNGVDTANE